MAPGSVSAAFARCVTAMAVVVAAVAPAAFTPGVASARARPGPQAPPARLADTGLYADFSTRAVDPRNVPYAPQYPLWSDGAAKRRWIRLPPGAVVDARDPEAWRFPVGTRFWKEFSWGGRPVETRYLERTRDGWSYAAYAWSEDQSDAVLAPEGGAPTQQQVAPGRTHVIPSVADCKSCHQGGRAEVLGFGALQLSPDRDPLAPHAEPLEPGMPTLPGLVERGLIRGLPRALLDRPPRVAAATPRGRAAMGYLHANCSVCHDSVGPLASLGVSLRHRLGAAAPGDEPALVAVGRPTRFRIPGPARIVWIAPGDPSSSAVVARMASREAILQMPPLGTRAVDVEALRLVRAWIEEDLPPAPERAGGAPTQ